MNKTAKAVFSLAMALCISALPLTVSAAATVNNFSDLPNAPWYYDYLDQAITQGFFSGTSATTFSPSRSITRAEAMVVLSRIHMKLTGEEINGSGNAAFKDVPPNSYYSKAVNWAAQNKIVSGYGDGRFCPNNVVTHAELAVIFHKYLEMVGKADLYASGGTSYKDLDKIPGWAKPHVQAISGFDIFNPQWPNLDTAFAPQSATLRDEAAALFVRLYEKASYPIEDNKIPRWACRYSVFDYTDNPPFPSDEESKPPFLPLGEAHSRILAGYEEYAELRAVLQEAEGFQQVAQPANLDVSEEMFEEYAVLAVEIRENWCPAFDCDFCGVTVENHTATATFVESNLETSSVGGRGYMFFVLVPKDTTSTEVVTLSWTEKNYWGLN